MTVLDTAAPGTDEATVLDLCQQLLEELPPKETDAVEFLGRQFDLGLAWVHFPEGNGGLGLSPKLQRTINETLHAAGAPIAAYRNVIGHGMGAPTIVTHGTRRAEGSATCVRCSPARRCGASSSPSRAPAPTSPASPPRRCATATSGSSTARRCGPPSPTSPSGGCSSPAPTPRRPSTRA